jgi:hypothetical protein
VWFKWVLGTHRIGCHEHMKPAYQHRLPKIEANYRAWMAKLEGRKPPQGGLLSPATRLIVHAISKLIAAQ